MNEGAFEKASRAETRLFESATPLLCALRASSELEICHYNRKNTVATARPAVRYFCCSICRLNCQERSAQSQYPTVKFLGCGFSPAIQTWSTGRNYLVLCAGTTPILEKTLREWRGKWKSFGWVRGNSGNRSESCSENCGFRIDQVARGHSENGISYSENGISNSESCSENTLELSQSSENGVSAPRAFFLKSGWFPGFWFGNE